MSRQKVKKKYKGIKLEGVLDFPRKAMFDCEKCGCENCIEPTWINPVTHEEKKYPSGAITKFTCKICENRRIINATLAFFLTSRRYKN